MAIQTRKNINPSYHSLTICLIITHTGLAIDISLSLRRTLSARMMDVGAKAATQAQISIAESDDRPVEQMNLLTV